MARKHPQTTTTSNDQQQRSTATINSNETTILQPFCKRNIRCPTPCRGSSRWSQSSRSASSQLIAWTSSSHKKPILRSGLGLFKVQWRICRSSGFSQGTRWPKPFILWEVSRQSFCAARCFQSLALPCHVHVESHRWVMCRAIAGLRASMRLALRLRPCQLPLRAPHV